ncbi:MAG: DegV family protein [Anaerolineales bacterium]|nr:DegV family protein [Anaerolineales bacterium]
MIRIVTDSTCDLPSSVVDELDIIVIPLYINIGSQGYLDGVELTRAEFYERMPGYKPHPTTAAPGADVFRRAYEQLAQEGASEVLSIHISRSLSAAVDVAQVAARQTDALPVTVLDARQLSLGTGFQVELAARAARQGRTMAEILALLDDQIARTHVFAALDTLEYLKRSGRLNGALAGFGNLLQLKPLLRMHEGEPTAERVRTSQRATQRLIQILQEVSPLEQVALVHTHASERAEELRKAAAALLPEGKIDSVDITPVIGANIGPGAVGFACISAR